MSEDLSRKRLGRGLAALIGEMDKPINPAQQSTPSDRKVPIEFISPNPRNPRRRFAEGDLAELAASIKEHGIVQPIVVRPAQGGRYEIIAGERRWRAAQQAGVAQVPVIVREVDDRVALEIAIIENVQRSDLNPVEEASGYQSLIDEHQYTQADLAQVIGKSRSHVANTLRLLRLPLDVRQMLTDGELSAGHARTLVTADNPMALAQRIVSDGLSVRQAEALAQSPAAKLVPERKTKELLREKDPDTAALERLLSDAIGLGVAINHKNSGGELRISYSSLEQLDDLCRRLQAR